MGLSEDDKFFLVGLNKIFLKGPSIKLFLKYFSTKQAGYPHSKK